MTTPSKYEEDSNTDNDPLYLWSRSQTPEENFDGAEGADEHGNWPHVGYDGEDRKEVNRITVLFHSYYAHEAQIRGDTWKREDGTSNTYTEKDIPLPYLKSYSARQQQKRQRMAQESRDIQIWSSTDIMNTRRRLRAQAYEEKIALTKDEPIPISEKLAALLFDKNIPLQKHSSPENTDGEDSDVSGSLDTEPDPPSTPPPSSRLRNRTANNPALSRHRLPGSGERAHSPSASTISSSSKRKGKEREAPWSDYRMLSTSSASAGEDGATRLLPHRSTRRDGSLNIRELSSASIRTSQARMIGASHSFEVVTSAGPAQLVSIARPLATQTPASQTLFTVFDSKRKRSLTASEASSSRPRKRLEKLPQRQREILQRHWTLEAAKAGAASITFVNQVDDEETPELAMDFTYLEREYVRGAGIPDVDDALLTVCICRTCTHPSACGCQADSEVRRVKQNGEEVQVFAYSSRGLFTFNVESHVAVIECNRFCRCDVSCINRTAQRPRQVPIEVFKTERYGWGVRSSADVERGRVIGLYTGLLVPRTVANKSSDQSFTFALDFTEDGSEPEEGTYSVDSTLYGEIRFLSYLSSLGWLTPDGERKLDAVLEIYQVVYDTIFEMRTPYVAFVAKKKILAGTEFTFDYCPSRAVKKRKGRNRCMCGASNCRGWLA
ncbi:SET domain-containing protein [Guyanagaster necrorhizus]|uniref:SET domain-containing protein n=1 Tax=Guyanagaster necrorhizus TaxID=856835 RepID=A0A9P7VGX4_9AGAR|nr:SET domain-containing protein [Guyanagaster necrorhizus MCA 3950]KAG7440352.1 SET domain-containing protein [Guyanagaster necrorhizus MCA 3950]